MKKPYVVVSIGWVNDATYVEYDTQAALESDQQDEMLQYHFDDTNSVWQLLKLKDAEKLLASLTKAIENARAHKKAYNFMEE